MADSGKSRRQSRPIFIVTGESTLAVMAVRPLVTPARRQSRESFAGGLKDRCASRLGLIPPGDHVDIKRINLDAAAAPSPSA
jgi:hypothetical protein